MGRHLITTADERTWKLDSPVLFLGEWCRLYDRRQLWESMDAVVAKPYGLQKGQKERDLAYVQALSGRLLNELTGVLNAFHGTHHDPRYWNIVLGHWLQRYVAVTFNRYSTLEQALENYEVSGTTILDTHDYNLATTDSTVFIWACNDDLWNHALYSRILSFWGNVKSESGSVVLSEVSGLPIGESSAITQRRGAKRLILDAANKVLNKLSRNNDAFIFGSFLPLTEEVALQISLGQFPQIWRSPQPRVVSPDPVLRQGFCVDSANYKGYECYVRVQLSEVIPSCYLEGYGDLVQQAGFLPWPAKPRFIFTSSKFDTDEVFKVWAGSKAEEGVPYFVGQHGNYQAYRGHLNWPEVVSCDKFLTWGWVHENPKITPAFIFKVRAGKSRKYDPQGGLLLVELHQPIRLSPEDSYSEFSIYQEEQFRFVEALPGSIRKRLVVRLHRAYRSMRWSDEQRWKERSPQTQIETGVTPIQKLLTRSRLVVHSYDSTGILETLALNIPTLCFWHNGLEHLLPEAKPYYELLMEAGILAGSPEQAAEWTALYWEDIGGWWESARVQNARQAFCEKYSRTTRYPIRELKKILTKNLEPRSQH